MATRYEFLVEGRLRFPVDMLRYDTCWPKTSEDAVKLNPYKSDRDSREITLIGLREPTDGRWESFGWKVKSSRKFQFG